MADAVNEATRLVTTEAGLRDAIGACRAVGAVAVDTEFMRTNTYYPAAGLLQLSDGESCWLVDPLAVDIRAVADLFADTSVVKVLHACSEDLEVFATSVGELPAPLYDTQVAAAILGDGYSLSYQALIERELNVTLAKDQTRSDWLARPLSDEQLHYAAQDVYYLVRAWDTQQSRLAERGEWVREECAGLAQTPLSAADPGDAYLRVKGGWKLQPEEQHVLRETARWRESFARGNDVPRNRVAEDASLIAVARGADSKGALSRAGMHPRALRKYAQELLGVAEAARRSTPDDLPALPRPSPANSNAMMKRLKAHVAREAERIGIETQMLATRRHLEALLRTRDESGRVSLPGSLSGWRRALIGDGLLAIANEEA
ncbi:MAG: ribonuclease D [Gammaproteobacteria bacterium]|nr:ribonuclease D [Gammaproteobacteria bacterium]|tara:strand:+ start:1069 stop:2190 length:1122 start_codon:yes stop_codon:yes gene_type:complete